MNPKVKSFLYFATWVIAVITYYNMDNADTFKNAELANNTIEHVSTKEALN